jgi:YesN/AraC family two-component response regulator
MSDFTTRIGDLVDTRKFASAPVDGALAPDEAAIRVLLADDIGAYRQLIRTLLEQDARFEVVGEAGDGTEALELARRERPDVVLLDVAMPVLDGLQAIPKLTECCPDTKLVVLSGFARDVLGKRALDLGASAYLDKGADVAQLTEALAEVVRKAHRRR